MQELTREKREKESATSEATGARVEIFDDADPNDMRRVAELLTSGIATFDTLTAQHDSLHSLTPPADDAELDDAACWIYYPWRGTLVHLLGPDRFRRLRLDRNRNKITTAEQEQLAQLRIGIVGLSVGSAIAHAIALEGSAGYLRLADFDELGLSNLNRLSATVFDLGINKAELAQRRIAELDPYLPVDAWTSGVDDKTVDAFLEGLDLVIEECDSFDVKVLIRDRARRRGIPLIMETSDRGLLDVERFDLEPHRPLFHGLVGDIDAAAVTGLSPKEKMSFGLRILQGSEISSRMAASVLEVGTTLSTWPQLGGDVLLGGASVAAAVRRFGLGEALPSGRVRIDIGKHLDDLADPITLADDTDAVAASMASESEPAAKNIRALYDSLPDTDAVAFAANRAPSGGNAQPWHLELDDAALTLRIDDTRTSAVDIEHRGSFVALGGALHNARVAAAHRNILGHSDITDDSSNTYARVVFAPGTDPDLTAQLPGVLDRITHRGVPDTDTASRDLTDLTELAPHISCTDGRIHLIRDRDAIAALAENISATDRIRFLTDRLHRDMISELRWPHDPDRDTGIDVTSLGTPTAELAALDLLRRPDVMAHLNRWDAGQALQADTHTRVTASNAIAVITQPGTSSADYIRGGAVAEQFWASAQSLGYSLHPITPLPLYATHPDQLRQLTTHRDDELITRWKELTTLTATPAGEHPTLILRIFRTATPAPPSRRRALPLRR